MSLDIAFYSIRINQFGFIFIPHLLKLVSYSHLRKGLAYNFIRTNKKYPYPEPGKLSPPGPIYLKLTLQSSCLNHILCLIHFQMEFLRLLSKCLFQYSYARFSPVEHITDRGYLNLGLSICYLHFNLRLCFHYIR